MAALAGVSVGTASKALNGRGQLREQTRERVRAAAEQLGFQPNTVARSLLHGRTYTVGLITTDHYGRFSIPLMRGAEDALGAGQMAAFMCESRDDPIREQHYVKTLLGRRVDGLIVAARRTDARQPLASTSPSRSSTPSRRRRTRRTARSSPTRPAARAWPSSTCSRADGDGSRT